MPFPARKVACLQCCNLRCIQDSRVFFPTCWILIGQLKFQARQPYARQVIIIINIFLLAEYVTCGILLCGTTSQRKRLEMGLILKLGTSHPRGPNSDVHFLDALYFSNFNQFTFRSMAYTKVALISSNMTSTDEGPSPKRLETLPEIWYFFHDYSHWPLSCKS